MDVGHLLEEERNDAEPDNIGSNEPMINGRFLERKIWNPLVYVADRLKKLRGSGQSYLICRLHNKGFS